MSREPDYRRSALRAAALGLVTSGAAARMDFWTPTQKRLSHEMNME